MTPLEEAQRSIHEAIQDSLPEGEIAIAWTLTIDVSAIDGGRYLGHRAGGGDGGSDAPVCWTALGMLRAAAEVAAEQVRECTRNARGEDERS
jgi:hypothetical protein